MVADVVILRTENNLVSVYLSINLVVALHTRMFKSRGAVTFPLYLQDGV